MIVHTINKYVAPVKHSHTKQPKVARERFTGKQGTEEHRLFIHERAFKNCKFSVGENVIYRKHPYKINNIFGPEYFTFIEWQGLSPQFIELISPSNEFKYVNSGNLTRPRRH